MNLNEATEQNLSFVIHELAEQLQVINRSILDPKDFSLKDYDDLKSIYEMVKAKGRVSVAEIHAIIDELSKYRVK
ncbi:DUF1128 domain-containing protein [Salirhabdus euzebyi]|nr:DUF1128 family protein [Salirhabdus euzebyi]